MQDVSWEVIGAVMVIIGTNFVFARWNYHTLMDKIRTGDDVLHKRINEVKQERQQCKDEHSAQAIELFKQLHDLVKGTNDSYSALMGKLSEVGSDVAVTKNNINIAKAFIEAIKTQTDAITKAIDKKGE